VLDRDNAAKRLGATVNGDSVGFSRQSLLAAIGGWLGVAETTLPTMGFLVSFTLLREPLLSVALAAALSVSFISWRILRRQQLSQAVVGFLAVALAAWLALREGGNTADYFVPGFFTNAIYGTVFALSAIVRWPIIGVLAGLLFGLGDWRSRRDLRRRFTLITLVWTTFFAARLAVQLPLYFASAIEALATARLIMGAPAYAALLALTWVMLRATVSQATKLETEQQGEVDDR
jgi:hypothetical protein